MQSPSACLEVWVFHTQVRKILEWNKRPMSTALFWIHWAPQRPLYWEFLYLQDFLATLLSRGLWETAALHNYKSSVALLLILIFEDQGLWREIYTYSHREGGYNWTREKARGTVSKIPTWLNVVYSVRVSPVFDKHMPEIPTGKLFRWHFALVSNSYLVNGWTPPTSGTVSD